MIIDGFAWKLSQGRVDCALRTHFLECKKCGLPVGYDGEPTASDWEEIDKVILSICRQRPCWLSSTHDPQTLE